MKKFLHPIKLKNLSLPCNAAFSPLAGVSDLPFRKIAREYFPGLIFCEMVKMDALVRSDVNTFRLLDYTADMHPIGAQLCGSKPEYAADSAKVIEDLGFDVVDLNCGCPVDKVTKDGSGSALLKDPHKICEILYQMIKSVEIPVTLKIRAGWDENSINAAEITKMAEEAGAQLISVHGRTRVQSYRGPANWDYIKEAVEASSSILVFGNGDIGPKETVEGVIEQSGCHGVLFSRSTMGNPAVYHEVLGGPPIDPITLLTKHLGYIKEYASGRAALINLRRVATWYLRSLSGAKPLRETINRSKTLYDAEQALLEYTYQLAQS